MTEKTKHEFVDDNPYLVYSGDVNTSYNADSASGGGGSDAGDSDIFWVEILGGVLPYSWPANPNSDVDAATNITLSATLEEIKAAVDAGKIVKVKSAQQMSQTDWANLIFDLVSYTVIDDGLDMNVFKPVFACTLISKINSKLQLQRFVLDYAWGTDGYLPQGRCWTSNIEPYPPFPSS